MDNRVFTSISSDKMTQIIKAAQVRVVLAAPAIFSNMAHAIIETSQRIGKENITIVLDCDDEVFRLGYGDFNAIKIISKFGLEARQAPGLRMGILICDERAWVFSPVALYVQPEIHSNETPNAIEIRGNDIDRLLDSINPKEEISCNAGYTNFINVEIGQHSLEANDIINTGDALKDAPPIPFDIARQVRVFQPYIQYVELHLYGCSIERCIVNIPHDVFNNEINEELEKRLKTSFNLISKTSSISSKYLQEELKRIRNCYVKPLGKKWGNVILKARRNEFDKEIKALEEKVEEHREKVERELQSEIEKSKEQIVGAFWENIQKNPPKDLLGQILEDKPTEKNAKDWLRMKIEGCFPLAVQILKKMELECQFKDVTFETLNADGFAEALKKAYPLVPWDKPFNEFKAAKEKDQNKVHGQIK